MWRGNLVATVGYSCQLAHRSVSGMAVTSSSHLCSFATATTAVGKSSAFEIDREERHPSKHSQCWNSSVVPPTLSCSSSPSQLLFVASLYYQSKLSF